jgi:hypothetical protein
MIDELKKLAEQATPGPWEAGECGAHLVMAGPTLESKRGHIKGGRGQICEMEDMDFSPAKQKANARFIAAANPAAVLALLERMKRLEGTLEKLAAMRHVGHSQPREDCPYEHCVMIREALKP